MRIVFTVLLLSGIAFPLIAADSTNNQDATTVGSKITDVTLYADRARVTRTANLTLGSGVTHLAFPKLPGWIDEGSLRVSLAPATAAELLDVQVEKTFLARPDDEEIRKAEAAVTDISDRLAALDDETAVLEAQVKQTDAIRVFSMEKVPKDAAMREIKVEEFGGVIKFLSQSMLETARSKREIDKKRRDLQPELRARQQKLAELQQRAMLEQRTVVLTIKGLQSGQVGLKLVYMLPGTTWEPVHELRASQNGAAASMSSFAVVTQTTGEDWDGVALTFSTQSPNATTRIPELEALLLGSGRGLARMLNPEADSFQAAVGNFEAQNAYWNGVANAGRAQIQQDWNENVKTQRARQARVVEIFHQVQQRGTTAQFPALSGQSVHTDGRTVRVPIGAARFEATPRIVAAPELSLNAAQTADLVNTSGQPLLPGKVLLYSEGAFVGTTETEFVAPGENFSIFLGVADRLKLSRTLDQKRSSVTWTGKRKRMLASFVVTAENLSDKPAAFQLAERIPVSETDEIRVIGVKLQPEIKPDVKGLVKWDTSLAAKGKKEFRIEYTLDYPAEIPQPVRLDKLLPSSSEPKPKAAGSSSAAPSSLYRHINELEEQLKK
jgi:uncharacterized protein (TIGR02231 family)